MAKPPDSPAGGQSQRFIKPLPLQAREKTPLMQKAQGLMLHKENTMKGTKGLFRVGALAAEVNPKAPGTVFQAGQVMPK